jgi:hypothetical protein
LTNLIPCIGDCKSNIELNGFTKITTFCHVRNLVTLNEKLLIAQWGDDNEWSVTVVVKKIDNE